MFNAKHIVITGGSSGLGLELAQRLAAEGARLTLIARDGQKLAEAAAAIRRKLPTAQVNIQAVDVCDEQATQAAMQQIAGQHAGIDMLINSAGILREGSFGQSSPKDFRDVMEINYFGLLNSSRAALPYLLQSRGRLVNIASMAGFTGAYGYSAYCASKHAVVGFSEVLRFELKPQGVQVHLVCPGEFDSPMVDDIDTYRSAENRAHTQTIPKASVESIAADTLAGIRANCYLIIPGRTARMAGFVVRHFPGLMRLLGDRTITRVQRSRQTPGGAA